MASPIAHHYIPIAIVIILAAAALVFFSQPVPREQHDARYAQGVICASIPFDTDSLIECECRGDLLYSYCPPGAVCEREPFEARCVGQTIYMITKGGAKLTEGEFFAFCESAEVTGPVGMACEAVGSGRASVG